MARAGRWAEAATELSKAIQLEANNYLALNARGVVFALSNRIDEARIDFEDAVSANANFAEGYAGKAYLLVQEQGPAVAAERAFEKALALSPHYALAGHGRAFLDLRRGWPAPSTLSAGPSTSTTAPRRSLPPI